MKDEIKVTGRHLIDFGRKVLSSIAQVHPYVKHRLYTAEIRGILPHNMFKSQEIIDDAIVELYEEFDGKIIDDEEIKIKLFTVTSKRLSILFEKEAFHKSTMSTSKILENELYLMEEHYEMDANNDLMMDDELEDISYQQDKFNKPSLLYNDAEKNIINTLDIHDPRIDISDDKREAFNNIYNWLPLKTSNILDLFVFGKLSYDEIARIKDVNPAEIKKTLQTVSKTFRKNLN